MVITFGWRQLQVVILEDLRGGLDDAQRGSKLVRDHRNEVAPQLTQLLLSGQRIEKLDFCLLALRDIEADDKHVGLTVDFNDVGRLQQSVKGTPAAAKPALDIAQRTFTPEIREEFRAIVEIHPYVQLTRVVPDDFVTLQPEPSHKRIVCLDKPCGAQSQDRDV